MERPIKVNLIFPVVYLVLTAVITLLPMVAKPMETAIGFAMILASLPVYALLIWWEGKPAWVGRLSGEGTDWLQRLLVVLPQVSCSFSSFNCIFTFPG
jgi:solute carrier family 7 L-type amino acid transporter-like protein